MLAIYHPLSELPGRSRTWASASEEFEINMTAYILNPRLFSEKHQYEDGQLCLFNPKDGEQYGWNPSRSTAVTVTAWSIQWIYAFYTWRATGKWPGIEERANPKTPLPPPRRRR